MPQVRKITGNHREVVTAAFSSKYLPPTRMASGKTRYPVEETLKQSSYLENVGNIFKDLSRTPFLPTNGKTGDNFVRDWVNTPSYDFAQGNITAGLYHFLFGVFMADPDLVKEGTGRKEEEQLTKYYANTKKVDLAYYNDEGILCGVSLSYCIEDPSLWVACTIRNTVGNPEDRDVLFLSTAELIKHDSADKQKELVESGTVAQEFLAFLKSESVAALFADTILEDGRVDVERLEELDTHLKEMHLINIGHNKVFQTREKHFEQQKKLHEQALKAIKDPALESAAKQSFARRNTGSLFLGFLVFVTLVNLALMATGVLAPFGLLLEGVKNYLAFAGAAVVGVASTAKIANNEHQLSAYQVNTSKRTKEIEDDFQANFEQRNREAFLAMDTKEAQEALHAQQTSNTGNGEVVGIVGSHEYDDSQEFGMVGELVDEVVHGDSSLLPKATHLVDSVSVQPPVDTSSRKDMGVVVPGKEDGIVIPTNDGTPIYS
ncbi:MULTISPECIES: hypothetical protein [unclassified Legionella]|uniref:hypothetical protein n=1 Tax=unclassified Legionella TaxID=2622702 RepID=UPI003AF83CBD